jgi:XTP/dITP diphosphohydrolase
MKVVFATHNKHKFNEIRDVLNSRMPGNYELLSLNEMKFDEKLPETADTIEGNAIQKAKYFYEKCGLMCFSDDTGLEVIALNNKPGVFSARYAGNECSYEDNVSKLLEELKGSDMRRARFRTVIAMIFNGQTHLFEGSVEGLITRERYGTNGFGYDPIFRPDGYQQTFAEMSPEAKNRISHRAKAVKKLVEFLLNLNNSENIIL